jgi:hypothetical protein
LYYSKSSLILQWYYIVNLQVAVPETKVSILARALTVATKQAVMPAGLVSSDAVCNQEFFMDHVGHLSDNLTDSAEKMKVPIYAELEEVHKYCWSDNGIHIDKDKHNDINLLTPIENYQKQHAKNAVGREPQIELEHIFEALFLYARRKNYLDRLELGVELSKNQLLKVHNFRISGGTCCKPDIGILAARLTNKEDSPAAVGICEIKREKTLSDHSLKQLIMYMTIGQCSMRRASNGWLLTGLLTNSTSAMIVTLRTVSWWDNWATIHSIESYELQNAAELIALVWTYILRVFSNWDKSEVETDTISKPWNKLPYFGYPRDVERIYKLPHIVRTTLGLVRKCFERGFKWENKNYKEGQNSEQKVVVKILARSLYNHSNESKLREFLPALKDDDNEVSKIILNHHIGIANVGCGKVSALVTLFAGDRVCSSAEVLSKWEKEKLVRVNFYEQVCKPAFHIISLLYYHGDIRPANVVCQDCGGKVSFSLIDWDDVTEVWANRSVKNNSIYPALKMPAGVRYSNDTYKSRAKMFTLSQLFMTSLIIKLCAKQQQVLNSSQQCKLVGKQSTPAGQQSTPAGQQSTSVGQQSTPAGQLSAPVGQQSAPAGTQSTPVGQQSTSDKRQSTPVWQQSAGLEQQSAPVRQQSDFFGQQSTFVGQQLTLVGPQSTPVGQQSAPDKRQSTPVGQQSVPAGQQSAPDKRPPTPVGQQSTPVGQQSTHMGQQSVPVGQQSKAVGQLFSPVQQQSTFVEQQSTPLGQKSTFVGQQSMFMGQQSTPFERQPTSVQQRTTNSLSMTSSIQPRTVSPQQTFVSPLSQLTPSSSRHRTRSLALQMTKSALFATGSLQHMSASVCSSSSMSSHVFEMSPSPPTSAEINCYLLADPSIFGWKEWCLNDFWTAEIEDGEEFELRKKASEFGFEKLKEAMIGADYYSWDDAKWDGFVSETLKKVLEIEY